MASSIACSHSRQREESGTSNFFCLPLPRALFRPSRAPSGPLLTPRPMPCPACIPPCRVGASLVARTLERRDPTAGRGGTMALKALRLVLFLVWWDSAGKAHQSLWSPEDQPRSY